MFLTEEERKLTIAGCRFCPMCFHADTVAAITCKETNSPRGRGLILYALEHGILKWDDPVVQDVFFKSFLDGLPQEWCAGHYDHDELVIDTRHRLVEKGFIPEEVRRVISRVTDSGSPYQDPGWTLQDFYNNIEAKPVEGADRLVFLGCAARSRYRQSPLAFFKILKAFGEPFSLLPEEGCCGMPLYLFGDFSNASIQAQKVAQQITAARPKELIILDADCYRMFLTRYRKFGAFLPEGMRMYHVSEWLDTQIHKKEVPFHKNPQLGTYHDPCSLARFIKAHEHPRAVIRSLFTPELAEMQLSEAKANCCGGEGECPSQIPTSQGRQRNGAMGKPGRPVRPF